MIDWRPDFQKKIFTVGMRPKHYLTARSRHDQNSESRPWFKKVGDPSSMVVIRPTFYKGACSIVVIFVFSSQFSRPNMYNGSFITQMRLVIDWPQKQNDVFRLTLRLFNVRTDNSKIQSHKLSKATIYNRTIPEPTAVF